MKNHHIPATIRVEIALRQQTHQSSTTAFPLSKFKIDALCPVAERAEIQ